MFRTLIIAVSILFFAGIASAQTFQGEFKDWGLFTSKEAGKKICYITSSPSKKSGTYKIRGQVYTIVTYRGKGTTPEVGIDTGYEYKKDSDVEFNVDGKKKFSFFTSPQTPQMSWAKDEQADKAVIAALKNGRKVTVKGVSNRNSTSLDTYSLRGFGAAYDKMISTCK
jgi:invasion protein IalB